MLPGWGIKVRTPEQAAADRKARHAAGRERHAELVAEWEQLRGLIPDGPAGAVLLSVLDVHRPVFETFTAADECGHCYEASYDAEPTPWPCRTYLTIRDGFIA
jgi:hypothetical protein